MISGRMFFCSVCCFSPFPNSSVRVNLRTPKPACLSCLSVSQRLLCSPWVSSSSSLSRHICVCVFALLDNLNFSLTLSVLHNAICVFVSSFSTCRKNCDASVPLSLLIMSRSTSLLLICLFLSHTLTLRSSEVYTHKHKRKKAKGQTPR